ncbi:DUF72 domain-containing protein [Portibacter lacus]|uniref:DUF72 domain-containing protein n=1 Tax=Portibacter lacus TaxID=1099794 RepID=A0AA37SN03_9BACT|nr:DUF72 domain-containing protein [Portibacter lacus]GLR16324.1 hypothetical protein GCM10007940_09390 [Portibacter lacus]
MKFGKLDHIDHVDFTLPEDNEFFNVTPSDPVSMKIYTGATSWINPAWKGSLYSEKTKKSDFLRQYSSQFNSIELNGTHYRTPSDATIETWVNDSAEDFKFCPKILQAISHRHDMLTNKELVNNFIVQLSKLGDKLGQCFIQLPNYFKYSSLPYLEKYLAAWPEEMSLAVEVRDEELHQNRDHFHEYLELLSKYNASPCLTDVSGRRDLMHMANTNDKAFVRWVGNGLHKTDFERIKAWVTRFELWAEKGIKEVYFMLHEPENLKTPEIAEYLAGELENIQYIEHRGPRLIKEQPNLFSSL